MSNEMFTQLPTVTNSALTDVICAVQGYVSPSSPGTSVQETLQQVFNLMLANTVLNNAGNPNGSVAGSIYQLCWDTSNHLLYVCTVTGTSSSAVWTLAGSVGFPISATNGGTGTSNPTAHTIPVAEGSGAFAFKALSNGQLLIGSSGADPAAANLTAGTNITINNSAGGITISASGAGGFSWTEVTGASQAMTSNNGYIANNGSQVALSLPTTSIVGDELAIIGKGAGGWSITQGTGQLIHFGSSATTVTTGHLDSTNQFDSVYLVCTVANTTWTVLSGAQGTLTVV